jgi:hypothetical protein
MADPRSPYDILALFSHEQLLVYVSARGSQANLEDTLNKYHDGSASFARGPSVPFLTSLVSFPLYLKFLRTLDIFLIELANQPAVSLWLRIECVTRAPRFFFMHDCANHEG